MVLFLLIIVPMSKIFFNPNQIEEFVDAALGIQERYGIKKALGYLIGEKFYNLVNILHFNRTMARQIEEERKKPGYNPIVDRSTKRHHYVENLDETYEQEKEIILEAEQLLPKFATMIKDAFEPHEIRKYFESHPRLGVHGHVATDEQYEVMVSHGAIEHPIDTEVEDALIFGDMLKYFEVS
jgi:hypothetical protein